MSLKKNTLNLSSTKQFAMCNVQCTIIDICLFCTLQFNYYHKFMKGKAM